MRPAHSRGHAGRSAPGRRQPRGAQRQLRCRPRREQLARDAARPAVVRDMFGVCSGYVRRCQDDGTWQAISDAVRTDLRAQAGRVPAPSVASIDSQSVKTTDSCGCRLGPAGPQRLSVPWASPPCSRNVLGGRASVDDYYERGESWRPGRGQRRRDCGRWESRTSGMVWPVFGPFQGRPGALLRRVGSVVVEADSRASSIPVTSRRGTPKP